MGQPSQRIQQSWVRIGMFAVCLLLPCPRVFGEAIAVEPAYAEGGEKACLKCHDQTEEAPVLAILKTPHAAKADSRSPLADERACQTCHGPSAAHMKEPEEGAPDVGGEAPEQSPEDGDES